MKCPTCKKHTLHDVSCGGSEAWYCATCEYLFEGSECDDVHPESRTRVCSSCLGYILPEDRGVCPCEGPDPDEDEEYGEETE